MLFYSGTWWTNPLFVSMWQIICDNSIVIVFKRNILSISTSLILMQYLCGFLYVYFIFLYKRHQPEIRDFSIWLINNVFVFYIIMNCNTVHCQHKFILYIYKYICIYWFIRKYKTRSVLPMSLLKYLVFVITTSLIGLVNICSLQ